MDKPGPHEGPTAGRGQWEREEHERVFRTLDAALERVDFPASKTELVSTIGAVNVAEERDLPLVKYLQGLPEGVERYRSADEVKATLNERWQSLRQLRGHGWGASEQGGAPELMEDRG